MAALYDQLNGWGPDYEYWLKVAGTVSAHDVVDLGCGTGQLTVLLARAGHRVVGIDPDPGMLQVARARDGHEAVTWVQGYAADIATASADLVTMTGHVSQLSHRQRLGPGPTRAAAGTASRRPGGVRHA